MCIQSKRIHFERQTAESCIFHIRIRPESLSTHRTPTEICPILRLMSSLYAHAFLFVLLCPQLASHDKISQQINPVWFVFEPGHEKMCFMSYANNKGADQPAHLRSLMSAFVVRCLDSIISLDSRAEISRL